MFDEILHEPLNTIVSNPIKKVAAEAVLKNGIFHRLKNQNKNIKILFGPLSWNFLKNVFKRLSPIVS